MAALGTPLSNVPALVHVLHYYVSVPHQPVLLTNCHALMVLARFPAHLQHPGVHLPKSVVRMEPVLTPMPPVLPKQIPIMPTAVLLVPLSNVHQVFVSKTNPNVPIWTVQLPVHLSMLQSYVQMVFVVHLLIYVQLSKHVKQILFAVMTVHVVQLLNNVLWSTPVHLVNNVVSKQILPVLQSLMVFVQAMVCVMQTMAVIYFPPFPPPTVVPMVVV